MSTLSKEAQTAGKWDNFPALEHEASPSPRPPQLAPPGQEYVDPFLFETGHFESREEYEELSRTAKIKRRARA